MEKTELANQYAQLCAQLGEKLYIKAMLEEEIDGHIERIRAVQRLLKPMIEKENADGSPAQG